MENVPHLGMKDYPRFLELDLMLHAYKKQIEGMEEMIPFADAQGVGRGYRARYWRKQADKYRATLAEGQASLARVEAELQALSESALGTD